MITFEQVSKKYNTGHTALEDVSFEIQAGEFVFLMGPSGSGKTTLLRLILREVEPSSGRIIVAEHDLSTIPGRQIPLFRRQIGSAFQDFKLIPDKSAFENVSLALEIVGKKQKEINQITPELLERVGLKDKMHLYPSQLSGGEVQRVAISRAIAADPVLLFADEPTGNLDPETSKEIVDLLLDIHKSGTTVIMATHDAQLTDRFSYRRLVLKDGVLAEDSRPPQLENELLSSDEEPAKDLEKAPKKKKKSKKKKEVKS